MRSILALLAAATLSATPALAAAPAPGASPIETANAQLQTALAKAESENAAPPHVGDPQGAALVRAAFDVEQFDHTPVVDLRTTFAICGAAYASMNGYLFFGAKQKGVDLNDAAQAGALEKANLLAHQDEIMRAMRFSVACSAKALPPFEQTAVQTPAAQWTDTRKQGLVTFRHGLLDMIEGVVTMQLDSFRPENRALVLDEVVRRADVYAHAMTLQDRAAILAAIKDVSTSPTLDKPTRAKLETLRRDFSAADCQGLCAFTGA